MSAGWLHDRHGKLVLWQTPNKPLRLTFFALWRGQHGWAKAMLTWWAVLELFTGVTKLRRLIGAMVLLGIWKRR